MNEELRTIRLYGKLGARFGRVHRLAVSSCAEAVQALSVLLPGFEREMVSSKDRGVGYACFVGKRNLKEENLFDLCGDNDIRIAPMIMGSKRGGLFSIVLGAALFFTAPYLASPLFAAGLSGSAALAIGAGAATLGKLLMLGGVMQLLSPQQKSVATRDGPDNGASYNFNGPVNTTAQGNPVPLLYGEMVVGSATISAGIYAENQQ